MYSGAAPKTETASKLVVMEKSFPTSELGTVLEIIDLIIGENIPAKNENPMAKYKCQGSEAKAFINTPVVDDISPIMAKLMSDSLNTFFNKNTQKIVPITKTNMLVAS